MKKFLKDKFLLRILFGLFFLIILTGLTSYRNILLGNHSFKDTAYSRNLQIFTDNQHGISFQYPSDFNTRTYTDFKGRDAIEVATQTKEDITQPLEKTTNSILFSFSKENIEEVIKVYEDNKDLSNLIINEIAINGTTGKKVSFTSPAGLYQIEYLLPWKNDYLLAIGYAPVYPETDKGNEVYQRIIASVKQVN